MTYAALTASIASRMHITATSPTYSLIPEWIGLAEDRIYRELRVAAMEASLNATIASGVISVPTGYRELKFAYVDSSSAQRLSRKSAEWIYLNYPTRSADSCPLFIAREASNFIFGPYPDTTYTIKGVYYKSLDALSAVNTSNWFTTNAYDLLLYASLVAANSEQENDRNVAKYEMMYQTALMRVQSEDDKEAFSGSPINVSRS